MRFLADENFPGLAVAALRAAGHDVLAIAAVLPGASDAQVLQRARQDWRIILTFDKDFGELARAARLPEACGVILFRIPLKTPAFEAGRQLAALVEARKDWAGRFSVIEAGRVRMRNLPEPQDPTAVP